MRRRLFEDVDAGAAERVAGEYRQVYEKTPGLYEAAVSTSDYLEQQKAAYPLHPELIDVIYKKWSTAPDFPRTRATLQLSGQRGRRPVDQPTRGPCDTVGARRSGAASGFARGSSVQLAQAGASMAWWQRTSWAGMPTPTCRTRTVGATTRDFHIARGVATTVLMHSFGGMERRGGTPQELRLGTVAPNVGPEYVTEVLSSLGGDPVVRTQGG